MLMTFTPRLSGVGDQIPLVFPIGQVACWASQSISNQVTLKPAAARVCQLVSARQRTHSINRLCLTGDQVVGSHLPSINDLLAGQEIRLREMGMNDIRHRVVSARRLSGFHIRN